MNAVEIEQAISDLALQPFDVAEFPYAFLAAFGNKEVTLKRLRSGNNNTSDFPGGVLLRNNIHIATCGAGNVSETFTALLASPATSRGKSKFVLATDGRTLEAQELATGETIACDFEDFPNHFGFLLPLAGISTIKGIKDNPIDVRATGRLNKLYVELLRENPAWAKDDRRSDMNHFMALLVFCFFAEDTGIFSDTGLFTQTVDRWSERNGSNTHEVLSEIFRAMNIKSASRGAAALRLPTWANAFPYVNGGLFSGSTEAPRFTQMARTYLLHAGALNWREINPDIFGSMIQAVADDEERGALGMHESRDIIFKWGIGINDTDNGVYLPRFKNAPVPSLPDAPLHGLIHTARYYSAVAQRFMFNEPTDTPSCREVLRGIKEDLVDGSFPWREE